jgi:hypothetical protein
VRLDSASLLRPRREVPLRPAVEAWLPPSLLLRPPEAPLVPAPPREAAEVVPPEVPLPVLVVAVVRPKLLPLLLADDPLRTAELPPLLEACPPFLATAVRVVLLADAKPRPPDEDLLIDLAEDLELELLFVAELPAPLVVDLAVLLLAPPLLVDLADDLAPPRLALLLLLADDPPRLPDDLAALLLLLLLLVALDFEADLELLLEAPLLLELLLLVDFDVLRPPEDFDAELLLLRDADLPALLFAAFPEERLLLLEVDFLGAAFFAADFELLLEALFEPDFEAPFLAAPLLAALPRFDPPLLALLLFEDLEAPFEEDFDVPLEADLELLLEAVPREDAPLEADLPPLADLPADFFVAAFLVAFAMI